ncbi:hypothetical protein IE53DRAFT_383493 [Violaceomyces palustris]|uniref:Uncharacterized protein n=1 Tax=Violaceomyces palustris TaxID=1673888 RepID=A0ACD0P769_9BASI|nr:hypothetical protein IE53DRAFT_383493 [Violaceomyces palustris]
MSVSMLFIHSPSTHISSERRLPTTVPLTSVKARLETITGIPLESQSVQLWSTRTDDPDCNAKLLCQLDNQDEVTLEQVGVEDGMCLKVLDKRPKGSVVDMFSDEAAEKIDMYQMDDETYANRADTVLAYKKRHGIGRFDPKKDAASSVSSEPPLPEDIKVGARCEVDMVGGDGMKRRGTVRYVGSTMFAKGDWVGVEYDEPYGKNDGSVNGTRYFECRPSYGSFVKPDKVTVGDFPVEEIDFDLDEDEEM